MQKPSVVIFDLGKVLVEFDYAIAVRKFAARSQMSAEQIGEAIVHSPLLPRYETGSLTTEQFYQEMRTLTGFSGSLSEFGDYFGDIFTPIQPMVELQQSLRRLHVPTFLFSNTNPLAIEHIRRAYSFYQGFNGHILSYEHHAMKPQAELYEVAELKSGHRRAEILYFDDRRENVEAGLARGWQALLHESAERTRAHVQQLGLLDHQGITKQ
jgi:putative hydrolase of the HAD superfamily